MRRHVVLIALILSIGFLVYKFESVSSERHDRPAVVDEGVVVTPPRQRFSPGDRISPVRAALSPTPAGEPDSDADAKCWEHINDQLRTNGYLESMRPKLDRIVGAWFYAEDRPELKTDETSTPGRFFQALAESGLLSGRELEPNHEHARKLLRDVADEDRLNSAPLLFAALLAEKDGDKAAADRLFEEAKRRPNYHSYVTDFTRASVSEMKSVDDWFEAASVNSRIPVPEMGELAKFLKTRDSAAIALSMIRNYPFEKEKPVSDVDYFPLEYAFGMSILKVVDPASTTLFPGYKEILKKSLEANGEGELSEFWISPAKYGCDTRALEPMLAAYLARLRAMK
jgi:hypothetical protein